MRHILLIAIIAWVVVSVPVSFVIGRILGMNDRQDDTILKPYDQLSREEMWRSR